ncbi:rhodanese-related sulfurtransferase [Aquibacillus albus]|uniref:Rhodanese-related sulfurtransferase n=1 Tax=Aquibacillus albus TaxID=1168171 RepID=A0ABS2N181_9BACI|nr:rhodanese-related sulfurtransferase [Aquibacillus albus]
MTIREMSAKEVTQKVINKDELFILDVRNEDAFSDWKMEGANFDYLNVPYFELLDGVEGILGKLPSDKEILVVCAKEGSSVLVADMLSDEGLDVSYLKGGMKAWSEHLEPVKVGDLKDGGEIYQFVRIGKGCLSYMVISNGEAAIVDATRMVDVLILPVIWMWKLQMFSIHIYTLITFPVVVPLRKEQMQRTGCHQKMQWKLPLIISH